jgi:hypothetical protein
MKIPHTAIRQKVKRVRKPKAKKAPIPQPIFVPQRINQSRTKSAKKSNSRESVQQKKSRKKMS